MFLKLEDLAEQGEQPVNYTAPPRKSAWSIFPWVKDSNAPGQGPGSSSSSSSRQGSGSSAFSTNTTNTQSGYTCSFMTDVDQRTYLAQGPQVCSTFLL
jgi:hypothetical protein